jgi:peptidoglycan hydrolase-like protein with peptidoglycan-binding domain
MAIPTRDQVIGYIRDAATKRGIDPDVAVAVAVSEGLNSKAGPAGAFASDIVTKNGMKEASYGAYQLYTGGGLGNAFQKATGLDPADPNNWAQTIDYALDAAAKGGWSPFHGAARVGISSWEGLKGSKGLGNYGAANAGQIGTRGLQQALQAAGFNPGKIDGVMGPRTREAVKDFQKANGLTVDGKVGPRTMAALNGTSVQTATRGGFRSAPGINIAPTAFRSGNFLPAPDVARFQRDTASLGTGKVSGGKGSYEYKGNARGNVNPALVAAVQAASAAVGRSITITSAARTNNPKSEHYVGKGGKGHGNAFDLDISPFSDQEKQLIARTLSSAGVTRMGTYTKTPSMLHIDMGKHGVRKAGEVHFMHNKTIEQMAKAPAWFRDLYETKLAVGKPTVQGTQVASNVVNQMREQLKTSNNGIAYASLSPKNAAGARTFGNTPVGSMPEQMDEGMSTSGYVPARERVNEYLQPATSFNPGMSPPSARQAAQQAAMVGGTRFAPGPPSAAQAAATSIAQASSPNRTVGAVTRNATGGAGLSAPAQGRSAAVPGTPNVQYNTQQPNFGPGKVPTPAPAPARQAVPASATQFAPGPPSAAQAEMARQVAGARAISSVPVSRQPAMTERFDPKIASPTGKFTPGGMTRSGSLQYSQGKLPAQVQAKGFTPPAIPGVTGPPLGTMNTAPGHVAPSSVADQYGIGPGGYGAGFDAQVGVPAPAREVLGWDANRGGYQPLSPSQLSAYDALGGPAGAEYSAGIYNNSGGINPAGLFSGLTGMLGQQQASSSYSPMAGIMGIFNGGAASRANPNQEYGQPGYDAMMNDPTVRASTEAILGRPLDGTTRHSTLDPATGLPVSQPAPTMPGLHMGRVFGAPGAPAAGLAGLLGLGGKAVGLGGLLGSLVSRIAPGLAAGVGPFGGVVGGLATQALGAIGRGIAPGGGAPTSSPSDKANMGVVTTRDASGRASYEWGPTGGNLSQGAANAGWANNNPERSYGGYGGGYDPTPV